MYNLDNHIPITAHFNIFMAALGNVLIQDVILTYKGVKINLHSNN